MKVKKHALLFIAMIATLMKVGRAEYRCYDIEVYNPMSISTDPSPTYMCCNA